MSKQLSNLFVPLVKVRLMQDCITFQVGDKTQATLYSSGSASFQSPNHKFFILKDGGSMVNCLCPKCKAKRGVNP